MLSGLELQMSYANNHSRGPDLNESLAKLCRNTPHALLSTTDSVKRYQLWSVATVGKFYFSHIATLKQ